MENVLVACSNVCALYPISLAYNAGDHVGTFVLSASLVTSFISHLVENHKHGMPGFVRVSNHTSLLWNRADVVCAYGVVLYVGWIYFAKFPYGFYDAKMVHLAIALACGAISEWDKSAATKWRVFIPFHCAWHVLIFYLVGKVLNVVY